MVGIIRRAASSLPRPVKDFIWHYLEPHAMSRGNRRSNRALIAEWKKAAGRFPPPAPAKHMIIKDYARRFKLHTLVETGTCAGDTVEAVRGCFKQIVSIELSPVFYLMAAERLARHKHIRLLHGDSGELLGAVLRDIDRPALFWLDAHETGGEDTARGDKASPIVEEMEAILSHPVRDHVILIDDAPDFSGERDGIPAMDVFRDYVLRQRPDWVFDVSDYIIRIHPSCGLGGRTEVRPRAANVRQMD